MIIGYNSLYQAFLCIWYAITLDYKLNAIQDNISVFMYVYVDIVSVKINRIWIDYELIYL